jgi:hypothetical protein
MSYNFAKSMLWAALLLQCQLITASEWHPAFAELHRRAENSTKTAGGNSTNSTNSTKAASSASSSGQKKTPPPSKDTLEAWRLARSLGWVWLAFALTLAIYVSVLYMRKYIRLVSCLNAENQRYFQQPNIWYGRFKKHFFDAPLFRKRHHREFQLSRAIGMGSLPSRGQTFFLVGYSATVIILTLYNVDFSLPKAKLLTVLTKRTGLMAIWNMLPLFVMAGRNNPLLYFTGITFDTYNLVHRWIGRIVCLEGMAHMTVYLIKKIGNQGWEGYMKSLKTSRFIMTGTVVSIQVWCFFTTDISRVLWL